MANSKTWKSYITGLLDNNRELSNPNSNHFTNDESLAPAPGMESFSQYFMVPEGETIDTDDPAPMAEAASSGDPLGPNQVFYNSPPISPPLLPYNSSSLTPSSASSFHAHGNQFPTSPIDINTLTHSCSVLANIDDCSMGTGIENNLTVSVDEEMQHQYLDIQLLSSNYDISAAPMQPSGHIQTQNFADIQSTLLLQDPFQQPQMAGQQQQRDRQGQAEELQRLEQLLNYPPSQDVQQFKISQETQLYQQQLFQELQYFQPEPQTIQEYQSIQSLHQFSMIQDSLLPQILKDLHLSEPLSQQPTMPLQQPGHPQDLQQHADKTLFQLQTQLQTNIADQKALTLHLNQEYDFLEVYSRKRSRKALSLQEKAEILDFIRHAPSVSVQELSKQFKIPRSTIYGIIDNRQGIIEHAKRQPGMSRKVENRFRILEEILIYWGRALESRGMVVTNRKLCAQAFETHRMLSSLLSEPLPQCLFTTGWLKGFKQRQASIFGSVPSVTVPVQVHQIKGILDSLGGFSNDDIYTCGITSMFLDMLPTSTYKDDMRQMLNDVEFRACEKSAVSPGPHDFTSDNVRPWLTGFDRDIAHKVALLVDEDIWGLFNLEKGSTKLLQYVDVICVPNCLASALPMTTRIISNFKLRYYTTLLTNSQRQLQYAETLRKALPSHLPVKERAMVKRSQVGAVSPLDTITSKLRIISDAWKECSANLIANDFERFRKAVDQFVNGNMLETKAPMEETNLPEAALKKILVRAYPGLPSTVMQYYLTQRKEIGPCGFLRSRILQMKDNDDFKHCFGDKLNFGIVWVGSNNSKSTSQFKEAKHEENAGKPQPSTLPKAYYKPCWHPRKMVNASLGMAEY
ncbi:hypothetical protein BGX27_005703 [Mortierella sp. AM989]|nr:hypothetical protein BGX27_005703 [Mortierella sp. AM989]